MPPPEGSPENGREGADGAATWSSGGRSLRWRAAMAAGAVLVGGYGVAVLLRPAVLAWTIAGACLLAALVLLASALLARGPR